jgi:hypothetical protein
LAALTTTVASFSKIVISLDAIDESHNREDLAQCLMELATSNDYSNVYVMVTSRRETEIERHLAETFITLSMSDPAVDDDIWDFIE